ncbi:MAG: beta-L-arabinofuranosidase domain-containing protein [Bacteroidales bacterium]|nr:glycoside hydrolase family 127 protein [Bacteroidales bacterium]MCK9310804.1 glycoside hydrolase family 127 protein [Bacteroidales bacterium]
MDNTNNLLFRISFLILFISAQQSMAQISPVNFSKVTINDKFWTSKINTVATVTLNACINYTENKTGRIRNFENVASKKGKHEGIFFDDSDVYKALEAIAYSLKNHPDVEMEKKADEWIDKIAAAQQPDGYINTYFTLTGLENRWTDMDKHETYCTGHLLEAGIAYYNTTGKRKLMDVGIRMVNHIDSTFRQSNRHWISGHEEIELALVKLYHATNEKRYLDLAEWFIEQRGQGYYLGTKRNPKYDQNDIPFVNQKKVEGHAVRAMYLYSGAADVAAATKETKYLPSLFSIWDNLVGKNMYITGGIGSSGENEGFSKDYDLPNESAYCETCASVGMIFWNQRMNLMTGEGKYVDILERSLYNGALAGLSLSGDRFFYGNPLASDGNYSRSEWFGCACCPSNIARLVSSIGNYIYATSSDGFYINLFIGSNTTIPLGKNSILLSQQGNYPWDGKITIKISPDKKIKKKLFIRIPGWATNMPVQGNAYTYLNPGKSTVKISLNNKDVTFTVDKGYAIIDREWKKDDEIILQLPMNIERVIANDSIQDDKGRVALQRGPLVYCFEHSDNYGKVSNIIFPDSADVSALFNTSLLGGIMTIKSKVPVIDKSSDGESVFTTIKEITAIPYYSWANREEGEMQVWIPRKIKGIRLIPNCVTKK